VARRAGLEGTIPITLRTRPRRGGLGERSKRKRTKGGRKDRKKEQASNRAAFRHLDPEGEEGDYIKQTRLLRKDYFLFLMETFRPQGKKPSRRGGREKFLSQGGGINPSRKRAKEKI